MPRERSVPWAGLAAAEPCQTPDAPLQFSGSRIEPVGLTVYIEPHGDTSHVVAPVPAAPHAPHVQVVHVDEVLVEDTQLAPLADPLHALAARAVVEVPAIDAAALGAMCRELRGAMLDIFKGQAPSARHLAYKRKGRDRDALKLTVRPHARRAHITQHRRGSARSPNHSGMRRWSR